MSNAINPSIEIKVSEQDVSIFGRHVPRPVHFPVDVWLRFWNKVRALQI